MVAGSTAPAPSPKRRSSQRAQDARSPGRPIVAGYVPTLSRLARNASSTNDGAACCGSPIDIET
jgi:hypothetical protein